GLEREPGARARLLEDHHQRAVGQRVIGLVALEAFLDDPRAQEKVLDFLAGQVLELQEVLEVHDSMSATLRLPGPASVRGSRARSAPACRPASARAPG